MPRAFGDRSLISVDLVGVVLDLLFAAIGSAAIAARAFTHAGWSRSVGAKERGGLTMTLGAVVLVGLFAGAALTPSRPAWLAVLASSPD